MNYSWLRSFLQFSQDLNFTKSAETLNISQPALFKQISNLSEDLEKPLYFKKGKQLHLTEAGIRLARFAAEIFAREYEFQTTWQSGSGTPASLAAGNGAFRYVLGPTIKAFIEKGNPLTCRPANGLETIKLVCEHQVHLGVIALEDIPDSLEKHVICHSKPILITTHEQAPTNNEISLKELTGTPLILPPKGNPQRSLIDHHFLQFGSRPALAMEITGWDLTIQFVTYGMGQAIVNDICALPESLRVTPIRDLPSVTYSLIHHPKLNHELALHLAQQIKNLKIPRT